MLIFQSINPVSKTFLYVTWLTFAEQNNCTINQQQHTQHRKLFGKRFVSSLVNLMWFCVECLFLYKSLGFRINWFFIVVVVVTHPLYKYDKFKQICDFFAATVCVSINCCALFIDFAVKLLIILKFQQWLFICWAFQINHMSSSHTRTSVCVCVACVCGQFAIRMQTWQSWSRLRQLFDD